MTEVTLHATPGFRDVVVEHVRIVGLAFRREGLAFAIFMVIGTIVIGTAIVRGTAASWFDSDEWYPVTYIAFLFSFAAWWRDRPFDSAFPWTLPVERSRLALAKVFAAWLWLMIALTIFIVLEKTLAAIAGLPRAHTMPAIALVGVTAAYLIGTAVLLGLRHPLRWLFGAGGLLFLGGALDDALRLAPSGHGTFLKPNGVLPAF
jgi:hypothetical protein